MSRQDDGSQDYSLTYEEWMELGKLLDKVRHALIVLPEQRNQDMMTLKEHGLQRATKYLAESYFVLRDIFPGNQDVQRALKSIYEARDLALQPLLWIQLGLAENGGWATDSVDTWLLFNDRRGLEEHETISRKKPMCPLCGNYVDTKVERSDLFEEIVTVNPDGTRHDCKPIFLYTDKHRLASEARSG